MRVLLKSIIWAMLLVLSFLRCAETAPIRIGVLCERGLPKLGAPSDPEYLAELLKHAGYEPVMLSARDMADPSMLDASRMPVVVLAYGPVFPADAASNWKRYLHEGGSFFSTGGYAFDQPVSFEDGKWLAKADASATLKINAHFGKAGDGYLVKADAIGVFDPSFPLRFAAIAVADPKQGIAPSSLKITGPFEGMVADAMVANNSRLVPILLARDRYGRPRGALGSLVFHWNGYYKSSAWAIWGVTNRDIFIRGDELMAKVFVNTIDKLIDKTYLVNARAGLPCYRHASGPIKLLVNIRTESASRRVMNLKLKVFNEAGRKIFHAGRVTVVSGGRTVNPSWVFKPNKPLAGGFYKIVTSLDYRGKLYDILDGGFYVWDEKIVTDGPKYEIKDNLFVVNGRPTYMPGCDMHGAHVERWMDGPLCWRNDAMAMRDFGMLQYQTLECWRPWDYSTKDECEQARRALFSKIDGEIMANRAAGLQYMPTQCIVGDVIMDDGRIAESAKATKDFYGRHNYPKALQYYIGGDILRTVTKDKTWLIGKWDAFLKSRYGTSEPDGYSWTPKLESAFAQMTMPGKWSERGPLDWSDFLLRFEKNYIDKVGGAVRKAVPGCILTIEYMSAPGPYTHWLDPWDGGRWLDISNVALWTTPTGGGDQCAYFDLGMIGKPMTVGEWGWLIHPVNGLSESDGDIAWLNQNCQVFGAGASQIRQWSWRDLSPWETWLFDWGAVHSQYFVPKEAGRITRCLNFLFRMPEPKYEVKPVVFLVPSSHKRGTSATRMAKICLNVCSMLGSARANYTSLIEDFVDKLPGSGVKAVVWPMPYCPSDATVARVEEWVRSGGALYISGDIRYDEYRQSTRGDRLERLGGVRATSNVEITDKTPNPPEVESVGAQWNGQFWVNKLGKGTVCYLPRNIEESADINECGAVYRRFLDIANLPPTILDGSPNSRCWIRTTTDGGKIYTLFSEDATTIRVPTAAGEFKLGLPKSKSSMIWVDGQKRVRALIAEGEVTLNGKLLLRTDQLSMIATLTPGDIRDGKPLVVASFWTGSVVLPERSGSIAVTGDVHRGKWRTLETRHIVGGTLSFDALQSREITIVGNQSDIKRTGRQVEAWIMRPWEAAKVKF